MICSEETTIDGDAYQVAQLGAAEGRRVLVMLLKVLGPSFARLAGNEERAGGTVELIGEALGQLASEVSDVRLTDLCRTFGQATNVVLEGKPMLLDLGAQELHFAGRYDTMFKWLYFCLKLNFGGFTSALGSMTGISGAAGAGAGAKPTMPGPPTA